uniref:Probable disease resistance protein RF9 n=1 Tax=Nicotiana tabacum TaxID=4097 RepID=A0A1S3X9T4_TOBAC|nr:PREDICTED: probable disease resistance protein RF9 [Nicotiana tabacum]
MVLKEFGTCIWIDILPDKFDMAKRQLVNEVHKRRCKSQRSLVVLDDMRSTEAWDTLRTTLQQLEKGSKILVTTQSGYIAEYISPMQYVHRMKLLDKPHCLALFKEVFSSNGRAGQMTTNAMEIMVETCEGVPQLIKELALNLAYMSKDKKNMEHKVSRKCRSNFLFQYYQKLPDHLKPCFLYLVHFLENQEIDLERLSHLWKVEGLLSTNEHARGERMMDVAERYLRELALKGMIELVKEEEVPTYKEFRACRTTGAIRNLCHDLSGEQQTFLKVMDLSQDDYSLSSDAEPCRLFIYLGNHPLVVAPKVAKNVRSLQIARGNKHQEPEFCWQSELLKFKEFKVLRILDFDGIDFQGQGLPAGILSLVPLKYLSFKGCILEELPSSISKLSYLQILDLRVKLVSNKTTKIPNVLWKMERLNHLYLPVRFETGNGEKLRLDTLTDLETLENFNTSVCKADDVSKFSNLQYVAAKVEGDFKDFVSITRHMKTPPTTQLYSSIDIINLDCYAEERHSVLRDLLRCKVVRALHFKGHIGRLPPYGEISKSFTQLVLNRSHLNEDSMITLQKLPSLRVLVLSDDAYMGEKMVCSASGFPQLKHLHLLNLPSLRSLEVETTAMPLLSTLNVKSCLNQRILRDCLNFRAGLRIVQS